MATIHLKRIDEDYLFETTDEAGKTMVMDIPTDQGGHGGGDDFKKTKRNH
jgi:hypothetical protein